MKMNVLLKFEWLEIQYTEDLIEDIDEIKQCHIDMNYCF